MKPFSFSKLKIFSLFSIFTLSMFSCQRTKAQSAGEGAFTVIGAGTTTTTLAAATLDTLYFKATITGSGPVTITNTFTGATGSIAGTWSMFVSLDGVNYFPLPGGATGGNSNDSSQVLAATALNSVPPASPTGTVTNIFNFVKTWTFPNTSETATTNGSFLNGNPFKYYMIRFISTTSTTVTLTGSARWWCRRVSGYQ